MEGKKHVGWEMVAWVTGRVGNRREQVGCGAGRVGSKESRKQH